MWGTKGKRGSKDDSWHLELSNDYLMVLISDVSPMFIDEIELFFTESALSCFYLNQSYTSIIKQVESFSFFFPISKIVTVI